MKLTFLIWKNVMTIYLKVLYYYNFDKTACYLLYDRANL